MIRTTFVSFDLVPRMTTSWRPGERVSKWTGPEMALLLFGFVARTRTYRAPSAIVYATDAESRKPASTSSSRREVASRKWCARMPSARALTMLGS